jgi:tRNA(Ile)-lysidine synthase
MLTSNCITAILPSETEKIFIAYSGGVDSHVLLHLSALTEGFKSKITAVYINHGLQAETDAWAVHCQMVAQALGVKFKCLKVNVQKTAGKSLEELAREARYQAFKTLLGQYDVVLLAQHREDQMETVLLQLFRGAGVQGLSAMPEAISFGQGLMCRPFLDIAKQEIDDYATDSKLSWVEDPSNKSDDFDRNFLRNQIVPQLKQKWPALDKTIARSARHCANAHRLSENLAKELFTQVIDMADQTLNIVQLLELDTNRQYLVIRQWFKVNQLRMPAEKIMQGIVNEVINAKESSNPEIRGQGYSIRRYRNKLFCLKLSDFNTECCEQHWKENTKQLELNDGSKLIISESAEGISEAVWKNACVTVKFRQGAEKIRLSGREGRHSLKKLYQEKSIPPWLRSNIPLIYLDGNLAAVADLWVSAEYSSHLKEPCYQIDWLKS